MTYSWALILYSGVLGLILGSFLNVVVLRYGVKTLKGRSRCPKCATTLRWYELIPLVSYCIQLGRCRHCESAISIRYPLVELITGIAFAVHTFVATDILSLAIGYIAILLGIALSLYDLQAQFLPAKMLYLLIGIGLVYYLIQSLTLPIVMVDIFMLLLPSIFLIMIHVVSRGKWMGVGDGILFIGLSLLLGDFLLALYALVVSSWLGAGIGSVVLLVEKRRSKKAISNSIPFGPFLVLGSFIIWWMSLANIYIV